MYDQSPRNFDSTAALTCSASAGHRSIMCHECTLGGHKLSAGCKKSTPSFLAILDSPMNSLSKKSLSVLIFRLPSRKSNVSFSVKPRVVSRRSERSRKNFRYFFIFFISRSGCTTFDPKSANASPHKSKMSSRVTTLRSTVARLAFSITTGCPSLTYFRSNASIDSVDASTRSMLFH